ncbi:MAG: polysaccharide export protein [Akkermansiaceae bacterium]|nr:polysaccharide export protein [Akkermansiaceae bacterium]NNM29400.1 polysaccharide export protein [Akkermansiaceae bacterium]
MNNKQQVEHPVIGRRFGILVLCLAALSMAACTEFAPGVVQEPIPQVAEGSSKGSILAPGDVISLSFPGATELSMGQRIRADGTVSLPILGDVSAAGKSVSGLQRDLERRYRPHLRNPEVIVILDQVAAAVYVSGQVLRPSKIPLTRPMTALEAIMEAGGFSPSANPRKVTVMRTHKGTRRRYDLNLIGERGGGAFYLSPYDIIHVSERRW